jgi:hypothetical protein
MRGEVGIEACLGEVKSMRIIGSQRLKSSRLTSEPKLRYLEWSFFGHVVFGFNWTADTLGVCAELKLDISCFRRLVPLTL